MANRMLLNIWLLYISIITTFMYIGYSYGALDLMLVYDQTYMCLGMVMIYLLTEMYQFKQILYVDNEIGKIRQFQNQPTELHNIPNGMLRNHVDNLIQLNQNKKGDLNQRLLLENLEEDCDNRNYANFIGEIIMRIGLLGTVIGLLIAMWTWIDQSYHDNVGPLGYEQIKTIIISIFTGLSPAFLTTVTGLILSIALLVSGKILHNGMLLAISRITVLCETQIIPKLDNEEK